jgi:hypothetical protein
MKFARWCTLVLTVALLFTGCTVPGQDKDSSDSGAKPDKVVFSKTATARYISNGITEQLGIVMFVECPRSLPKKKGKTFTCWARSTDSGPLPVKAEVADSSSNSTWRFDAISTTDIARSIATEIKKQKDVDVTVDCPDAVPLKKGSTFTCEALDSNSASYPVHVEMTDEKGNVSWKV